MKDVKKLPVVAPLALILTIALLAGQSVSAAGNHSSSKGKKSASSKSKAGSKGKGKSTTATRGKGKGGRNVARSTGGRNSRRGRSRAAYLARVRAVQAHDAALRNIAASNIQNDNAAGEDPEIRRAAVGALAGRSGTVVVMDPNNGRILAVVNQRMALSSPVKPCSTVKLIVGLGALHEGVFDPNQDVQIAGNGYSLNLTDALAHSNNLFFQVLGRRLGFARVMKYAENFGFGQVTGANYAMESPGFLPEEGEEETGHMSSHGDGIGLTAIQLATFTAAIANGGNLYVPHAPRTPEENIDFKPILRRKLDFSSEDRLRMLSGMIGAVNFGTAKLAYDPIGQVAGKTGTCTDHNKLGLFTSFSSINNPKLVVTVIKTGSAEAGKRAAEVAGRVYRSISVKYLREAPVAPAAALIELPTR